MNIDKLNGLTKIGAVREIREQLKAGGNDNPGAKDIMPIFSRTRHARGEEKDIYYLYTSLSTIRKEQGIPPAPRGRKPGSKNAGSGNGKASHAARATPAPEAADSPDAEANITLGGLRLVRDLVPQGMAHPDADALVKALAELLPEGWTIARLGEFCQQLAAVTDEVGGLDNVRYALGFLGDQG